ncbi:helix-turn-helix domain-containing protein [Shewanella frigidimarina]|uniref:helix-turn-helix domain-containing protein n=1 Tax=Shewanella frigidimarina TaxID=56812 RepID=UPI003D7AEBD7
MSRTLHTPEYRRLIEWLKAARIERGLTMRELASELGVPHSYVGKVEQCERKLDVLEYVYYCKALNEDPLKGVKILSGKVSK